MNYATNIALADKETHVVTNIIWGLIYQLEEFSAADVEAIQIDDLAVQIGDYCDGKDFYRNGEKVLTNEEIFAAEINERDNALAELIEIIYETDMEEFE